MTLKKKNNGLGLSCAVINTPLGFVEITTTDKAVRKVHMGRQGSGTTPRAAAPPILGECCRQLEEYFSGKRRLFDLALDLQGTEFEQKVWRQLLRIPYGQTASYQETAEAIGRPKAVRAVGAANGKNPVAIIVPCHRVIGRDGRLVGYGGGLWRKKWLLDHESRRV
ncbi:MAG TPA: methylated-DNA--[protein]-cysteine S-methyltransferase [Acidobacteriota bacterium]